MVNKTLFLAAIFVFSLLGHLYVFWNLSSSGSMKRSKFEYAIATLAAIGILMVASKCRLPSHAIFNWIHYLFSLWFGFYLIIFTLSAIFHFLKYLKWITQKSKYKLILILSLLLFSHGLINANIIHVQEIEIKIKDLNKDLRIVHLSDLHIGVAYQLAFVERIRIKVLEIRPDFVVITGDLFDGPIEYQYEMIKPLDELGCPVFFVMGNHDLLHPEEALKVIEQTKFIYLKDTIVKHGEINLIGLDYFLPYSVVREKLLKMSIPSNETSILLYHAPVVWLGTLSRINIKVHLAGHTHGGQIFPLHYLQRIFYYYLSGLYSATNGTAHVYVSPGLEPQDSP